MAHTCELNRLVVMMIQNKGKLIEKAKHRDIYYDTPHLTHAQEGRYFLSRDGKPAPQKALIPIADFSTERERYQIDQVVIDIELTDFGFRRAHIDGPEESQEKILSYMKLAGIDPSQKVDSPLFRFLKKKSPAHYQILVNAETAS